MTEVNQATIDLIKEFEGYRSKAYKDAVGVWTIGYGTTAMAGVGISPQAGMTITTVEAEYYLQKAVDKFARTIRPAITAPINENQFGAFVSLAYNIGPSAFKKSSSLRHFNAGNKDKAANNILLWNKAGGKVLNGLVRRRKRERDLFLAPATIPDLAHQTTLEAPRDEPSWLAALISNTIAAIVAAFKKGA